MLKILHITIIAIFQQKPPALRIQLQHGNNKPSTFPQVQQGSSKNNWNMLLHFTMCFYFDRLIRPWPNRKQKSHGGHSVSPRRPIHQT
jgi:hypothetical protein